MTKKTIHLNEAVINEAIRRVVMEVKRNVVTEAFAGIKALHDPEIRRGMWEFLQSERGQELSPDARDTIQHILDFYGGVTESKTNRGGGSVNETFRAQKAVNAIKGRVPNNASKMIKTFAILSAENPMGQAMSPEENEKRRTDLLAYLSTAHYRYFKVKGQYGNKENSLIIYNIPLDDTLKIGDKFGQESVIWCHLDYNEETNEGGGVHYEYWERDGEDKPLQKKIEKERFINAANFEDMFTQVKRGFKIQIPFFEHYKSIKSVIEKRNVKNIEQLVNESLDDKFTKKHQWQCRGKLNGRQGNIVYDKVSESEIRENKEKSTYLVEGVNSDSENYTHYAVSKINGKIVNAWNYSDISGAELRQFKRDYFRQDLIDNEIDPKQVTVVNKQTLIKRGINPDDDNNWSNTVDESKR